MLQIEVVYQDYEGMQKALAYDQNNDDCYLINLTNLTMEKVWNFDYGNAVAELCSNMDFESCFEMTHDMQNSLILFLESEIISNESSYDTEDILNRQRLEWLGKDPYLDGGFEKAKSDRFFNYVLSNLIEWSRKEYGEELDFKDMKKIPIAYTNAGENERYEIQLYIDLEGYKLWTEINGELFDKEEYNSLHEFWHECLKNLNFDSMVGDAVYHCERAEATNPMCKGCFYEFNDWNECYEKQSNFEITECEDYTRPEDIEELEMEE